MSNVIKLKNKPINLKTDFGEEFSFEAEKEVNAQIAQKVELQNNYEKAFQEGYESARHELQSELDNQLIKKSEEFYSILSSFESKLAEYDSSLPEIIANVSIMVAEKIVSAQLENKSTINETIKKAVQKIIGTNEILIKINPKDYAEARGHKDHACSLQFSGRCGEDRFCHHWRWDCSRNLRDDR